MTIARVHLLLWTAVGLIATTIVPTATAQYKYVGPDGKVTYSDQPPPPSTKVVSTKKLSEPSQAGSPLPYELQQATSRYPVVLYTGEKCAPCEDARAYLRRRGVPFTEKTVTSNDDIILFRQQSPEGTAPLVTVGGSKSIGFSQSTWAALLDNAGYPATNTLPRDYQAPLPSPLSPTTTAPSQAVAGPATQATPQAASSSQTPATPAASAPPGFRF
jgi:glutaredoxin